ncbi:hypothetical protein [Paenibacillus ihuae]|uniref:hypothetical protein n=1 Tax=Paenibacillus ihuae TaxID=1232431 RepID=UPI000A4FB5B6|nr:hypothetical protein [Paenibacillus ihuae]
MTTQESNEPPKHPASIFLRTPGAFVPGDGRETGFAGLLFYTVQIKRFIAIFWEKLFCM